MNIAKFTHAQSHWYREESLHHAVLCLMSKPSSTAFNGSESIWDDLTYVHRTTQLSSTTSTPFRHGIDITYTSTKLYSEKNAVTQDINHIGKQLVTSDISSIHPSSIQWPDLVAMELVTTYVYQMDHSPIQRYILDPSTPTSIIVLAVTWMSWLLYRTVASRTLIPCSPTIILLLCLIYSVAPFGK